MGLISFRFAVFLGCLLLLYYSVPLRIRWTVLLAGSLGFYFLSAQPGTFAYLLLSVVIIYCAAKYIAVPDSKYRKQVYFLAVIVNVGLLFLFKYINGFYSTGAVLLGAVGIRLPEFNLGWVAPLGMSFYTLQLIGYLTDVYWGISEAQENPAKLMLFASYFPAISSGPILRYGESADKLYQGHRISYQNLTYGLQRMLWGLFKKIVIAERLSAIATPIFADITTYGGVWIWIGLIAAVLQIYADFSGNMDFILGASECFGVRLPENFRQPFFSLTIQEFWQRWHITLGGWLKDYVMYPLLRSHLWGRLGRWTKKRFGKKVAKVVPTFLAMLVLWIVNGIWHTPYLKYMATVLWFWFAVMFGQLTQPLGEKLVSTLHIQTDCFSWRLFQRFRTVATYSVGALFFCASSVRHAMEIIISAIHTDNFFALFSGETMFSDTFLALLEGRLGAFVLLASLVLLFRVEAYQDRGGGARTWLAKQNLVFRWVLLLGLMCFILIFGVYGPGKDAVEFIYAGF